MDHLRMHSADLTARNIDQLSQLFPAVVTETRDEHGEVKRAVDFDLLRQELSDHVVEGPQERYQLDWPGKREALFAANAPIAKTLRPQREESVDFDTTKNIFIEGDNLEALKLLQESYLGKVKLIYIDPPYNTGHDFVYNDSFAQSSSEYLERSGQKDESGAGLKSNPESNGRFHSDWLSMMYPRLTLARNLLSDDGAIFISMSDSEIANLKNLGEEIFGPGNFIGQLVWEKKKKGSFLSGAVSNVKEYIVCFARHRPSFTGLVGEIARDSETYPIVKTTNARGTRTIRKGIPSRHREQNLTAPAGTRITAGNQEIILRSELSIIDGKLAKDVVVDSNWIYSQALLDKYADEKSLYITQDLYFRRIVTEPRKKVLKDLLPMRGDSQTGRQFVLNDNLYIDGWGTNEDAFDELHELFDLQNLMSFPKPTKLVAKLVTAVCRDDRDALILDFFAGSGTTADAIYQLNATDGGHRRSILVQLDESIESETEPGRAGYKTVSSLARERLRRAGNNAKARQTVDTSPDLDVGFRALRIDTTNMADTLRAPDALAQGELTGLVDNVKPDRSGEDLLFQVMLDWGLDLSLSIAREEIDGREVFSMEDDAMLACFAQEVTPALVTSLAARKPLRVVFRDSAFATDSARINAEQVFAEVSPGTDVKVI